MQLILLRHGTRGFTIGDAPLNSEGLAEALELSEAPLLQKVSHIFTSPKKRAQMTIEPLAHKKNLSIRVQQDLDQMNRGESGQEFHNRVGKFLEKILGNIKPNECHLLCSHSDWLSEAVSHIPTDEISIEHHMFHCAEYLIFQKKDDLWSLGTPIK